MNKVITVLLKINEIKFILALSVQVPFVPIIKMNLKDKDIQDPKKRQIKISIISLRI